MPFLLGCLALCLYLIRLGHPQTEITLDEHFYLPDARATAEFGTELDVRNTSPFLVVHPPVAKWFIAGGMKVFGLADPIGWRVSSAVFGAIGVLLIALIARRLVGSLLSVITAGLLLMIDGLWFVFSRVAMLDIYLAVFILAATWCLMVHRDTTRPRPHGMRLAAGACLGLAVATKWTAIPAWAALVLLAGWWEIKSVSRANVIEGSAIERLGRVATALIIMPTLIYVGSYTPWFLDDHRFVPRACRGITNVVSQWGCYQAEVFHVQKDVQSVRESAFQHPYQAAAWTWPWAGRPVPQYVARTGSGSGARIAEVMAFPNPVTWLLGVACVAWLCLGALRSKLSSANDEPNGEVHRWRPMILAMIAANFLPYLVASAFGRQVYLFYAVPLLPFVILSVIHVGATSIRITAAPVRYAVPVLALAGLLFAFFYPLHAALPLPLDGFGWRARIWWTLDCGTAALRKSFCWV
jgi:dolichyl-phosphate-mannose-protein mannosyltransferase